MQEERRKLIAEINSLHKRLNAVQLLTLVLVEEFGWRMKFVRLPRNQKPVHVVFNDIIQSYAVLDEDGSLNIESGIKVRNDTPASLH